MRSPRNMAAPIGLAVVALTAAACGGGSPNTQSSVNSGSGSTGPTSFAGFDNVAGLVTAANAAGARVNTSTGKKNVAFGTVTRFTKTSSTTRSELAIGECVMVTPTSSSNLSTSSATAPPTAAPSAVTAKSVTITSTTKCAQPSFRSGNGSPPPGTSEGDPPAQPPRGNVSRSGFGGVVGTIASISRSGFVVAPAFGSGTTMVTTSKSTRYDVTARSSASQVAVGQCMSAVGSTANDGALDAQMVMLSPRVNGTCKAVVGFGGFGGPRGNTVTSGGPNG